MISELVSILAYHNNNIKDDYDDEEDEDFTFNKERPMMCKKTFQ